MQDFDAILHGLEKREDISEQSSTQLQQLENANVAYVLQEPLHRIYIALTHFRDLRAGDGDTLDGSDNAW